VEKEEKERGGEGRGEEEKKEKDKSGRAPVITSWLRLCPILSTGGSFFLRVYCSSSTSLVAQYAVDTEDAVVLASRALFASTVLLGIYEPQPVECN